MELEAVLVRFCPAEKMAALTNLGVKLHFDRGA
jgi:hypothetical protein